MDRIGDFYNDQHIFITGGSGFIGKVLVERLLQSFPNIGGIYLLMRAKKKSNPVERLQKDLLDFRMFDKLRENNPKVFEKLHVIGGDLLEPNFGISEIDFKILKENITIVIHSAATIRFNDHLRLSLQMNVIGTQRLVRIARDLPKLISFVHVSTAYANCDKLHIEEKIYDTRVLPKQMLAACDWMDDEMLTTLTPSIIGDKPNTYTFTKHLAEAMLLEEATDLPLAIVRPSIVGAAVKDPMPGWIDNYNGPGGFYVAAGKGLLRSVFMDAKAVADIVPVDYTANMIIAVAWKTAQNFAPQPGPSSSQLDLTEARPPPLIYHCTTGTVNPFTWEEMEIAVRKIWKQFPIECLRVPTWQLTNNYFLHKYWVFVGHIVPAYIYDLGYRAIGRRPQMVHLYRKLHSMLDTLQFFTLRSWTWTHTNSESLLRSMHHDDRRDFNFDPRQINWPHYVQMYYLGTKQYLLNEDLSQPHVGAARTKLRRLRHTRFVVNFILGIAAWRLLIARSEIARNLWSLVLSMLFKLIKFLRITSTITK